jgi:hypothetical protein
MFAWTHTDNALDKACLVNDGTLKSSGSAVETLEADTWYHIACVKDSANLILYVNGKESARSSVGTPVTSSQMLTLGSGNDGQIGANPENFFDGLIDDVRIHNRALTADEIKRLYVGTKESYFNVTNSPGTLSDGLVGHWSFDGPVTGPTWTDDVSGNGNRGTLQNGPKAVRGLLGQALEFDGTDDYVQRNSAVVTGAPFSVCAWVKLDQLPTTRGDSSTIFSIGTTGNSSNWFNLRADGSDGTNTVQFNARDGNPAQIAQTSTTVTPGVWQHYCGVATSATDRKVYLNAGNVGANTTSVTPSGLNKTAIGVLDVGGLTLAFTDGLIDDVRVYNRALSEDEIKRLYNPKQ